MRKAERALSLEWTPEGKAAWWPFWRFQKPSFDRMIRARNTPNETQAAREHEAILLAARGKYEARMAEIAKLYA
jgi:hypothetical protein